MLVKIPLYGDVSKKPMMGMIYPFFAGTLTFVRTIEMFVKIFCHRFFSFGGDD
jgi:zinc transporter ZupT